MLTNWITFVKEGIFDLIISLESDKMTALLLLFMRHSQITYQTEQLFCKVFFFVSMISLECDQMTDLNQMSAQDFLFMRRSEIAYKTENLLWKSFDLMISLRQW